ncbi:MAG TPA: rod shape-determining protein MreC [Candidatus Angelobacter sp.]|jgi:rod shape-determining protein MreC
MENFFVRYKNPLVLMAVLFIQVVSLATQVKRPENARAGTAGSGTRLIRVWTVTAFTPVEKMFVSTGHFFRNGWHNYADLRGVRQQNHELRDEVVRLQMEQVQLKQDADQARRLQVLLEFKEKYISKTVAAQVIATSGTEQSRMIVIDKGAHDGIKPDMAVITPDGIVGKIKDVFPLSSQVLLINDHDSGAGVILEHSRLQGIVKGTSLGELQINDIMSDEQIEVGDHVITSGGDRIYPKGFSVGTVISFTPDHDNDPFLAIKIKPSADLRRLEEVMVVTKVAEETPSVANGPLPMRAADILAQRLPSIPKQDPSAPKTPGGTTGSVPAGTASATPKPLPTPAKVNQSTGTNQKPGSVNAPTKPATTVTGAAPVTPAAARKTGADNNPASSRQSAVPAGVGAASASPTPVKPKPAAKKPKVPDATTPGATEPKNSEPKASAQPAAEPPAATPTPEKPQL